jgi:hypothetical protein
MLPNFEVITKHGTLLLKNKSEAYDINSAITFINKNTREEDYIFVIPGFAPPFYAMTNRKILILLDLCTERLDL